MSRDNEPNETRDLTLEEQYAAALAEWQEGGDGEVWDVVIGDECPLAL